MTRLEYELLREQEPQLCLPDWYTLRFNYPHAVIDRLEVLDRESLIASRVAVMLGRQYPTLEIQPS